jgi:signal transduction histidine kinase
MITNERIKRLERLLEVIRMVSADLDDFTVLQSIISVASELTQSEVASVLRYNEEDGYLHFVAAPWFHRDSIESVRVPLGESIAGWVFKYGKPLVIQDVKGDKRFYSEVDEAAEFQTKSILAVPLLFNGEPVGVFEAINKTNRAHYNGEDVTILETLASLTALIVRNRSLKDEIVKTKQEAERLEQMKKDFIAISSHELRTPLGLILGHATFLREVIPDEHQEHMDTIVQSGAKLKGIIENMANVDNYQSGAARLRMRKISIVSLIKNVIARHQEKADAKNVQIRLDASNHNLLLEGDANKIEIIVDNLLDNAITFTTTGGHVFVVVEQLPGYVKVSIVDDGIGIAPQELKRVFDRFYQVQSHLTRQHGGMGLGLSVAKAMVEMHGGDIWAESIPEKGSRFNFRLPLDPQQINAAKSVFGS